tara:strand:- start:1154 stop:1867 length:714 start_codon:yes stop_codon:yes gene_type:complete
MSFLILIRHGQSIWNLENRFTGWVDVDLTDRGKLEAETAGKLIKEKKINIDLYYSSLQLRANNTLKIIQEVLDDKKGFVRAWELNERHYGALTGLNKLEMIDKLGEEEIRKFRRSWDIRPEALSKKSSFHPINIQAYKQIPKNILPDTESLKDTYKRVLKFFIDEIQMKMADKNILISAHGNSIRALCKYLFKLDENQISKLEIPTGNPLVITLNKELGIKKCEYLDPTRSKDLLVY